jgi:phosphoribosylaminoimidazolecarboxamide formyltransferase/IMP cyclohydrolase
VTTVEARTAAESPAGATRGRIAVCVSGQGSNLRALHRAARRGALGGEIVLVLADRPCPALEWAAGEGIPTALVAAADHPEPGGWDRAVAEVLASARPDVIALAGLMRRLGPASLAVGAGERTLNVHPSLLPAFPGAHAVRDALRAGVAVTGVTVHLVDDSLDGGPIVAQEAVPVLPGDDEASLAERLHAVEHRLLPRCVALLLGASLRLEEGRVVVDLAAAARLPAPRRALLSVSDKRGLVDLGRGLDALGFELVSTGGTARVLREAGLEVTDVSSVTGSPEMLDGRVKTLHPRVHAGVLADLREADHRAQLAGAGIAPFELVVVNLYPFAEAAERPGIDTEALIEEIDIGGPTLVRAAAKNHASVGAVTRAEDYPAILDELRREGRLSEATRRRLALDAFRHTADYDARIAAVLPERLGAAEDSGEAAGDARSAEREGVASLPPLLRLDLERIDTLRYGENPHQAAALYRAGSAAGLSGAFARGIDLRQGKPLSYNNILDAAAAIELAQDLQGAGCVIVKHANPCGAAEAGDPLRAWELALAADPVSAFGGVVALTRPIDGALAERLTDIFLEVIAAPGIDDAATAILESKPNLRLLVVPDLDQANQPGLELRTAAGAVLVTEADRSSDDAVSWTLATSRAPSEQERADLDLAWRVARHVRSNAIVFVRDGAVVGVGAGQMSRVDSSRLAVAKAGPERSAGAACASDAFFPFADGVEVCLAAGVIAFVQPGGSQRDAEVIAAAEDAGATMLLTGRRHFRH